jgi:hypothetical protein
MVARDLTAIGIWCEEHFLHADFGGPSRLVGREAAMQFSSRLRVTSGLSVIRAESPK